MQSVSIGNFALSRNDVDAGYGVVEAVDKL